MGHELRRFFDATAITGLKRFAANIQQMLMPNTTYWAKFKPGHKILEGSGISEREAQIECKRMAETLL